MEHFKKIFQKLLFPGLALIIISVPISAALLVYIFVFGHENSPAAYLSYVFSAYSLMILCAWIAKNARKAKKNIQSAIHKNKFVHRYLTDIPFKMQVSLYFSLGINLLYAVMKLFYGVYYRSVWFGTLAVYYVMLAVLRFLLLHHSSKNALGKNRILELKRYRLCGVILMLMNIALSGVVILAVRKNEGFEYAGYLIYVMAMYAFYNVCTAVQDVAKYRKYNSPVMSAAKGVKLAAALVSMLSLETAMLTQFDEGKGPEFRQSMTGITGRCVCLIILVMAVSMIIHSSKQL
ncbi:MAG: hypothetical protein ACI4EG_02350 [Fusicatenibacter sp.]